MQITSQKLLVLLKASKEMARLYEITDSDAMQKGLEIMGDIASEFSSDELQKMIEEVEKEICPSSSVE
jgi:hypothetical protein